MGNDPRQRNATKLSAYNIFSLPLNQKGQRILLNTRSGKELLVTAMCYEAIMQNMLHVLPQPIFQKLRDAGVIIDEHISELEQIVAENVADIASNDTLYEVIMPSANCQLGCYYCGQKHDKHSLSAAVMTAILDRIHTKLSSGKYKSLFISWFGGEPLMALQQIRTMTFFLKTLAEKHQVPYASKMVSNGLSLKANIFRELATELSVKNVEVTLDGLAEHHDAHRYTKEGYNSFDLIMKNLVDITSMPDFKALGCTISLRSNIDQKNFDGFVPLLKTLREYGFQDKVTQVYPIRVYAWGNDAHTNSASKEAHAQEELQWFSEIFQHDFMINLVPKRRKTVCLTVNKDSDVYDAYGNIHNCTETPYVPVYEGSDYSIGNVLNPDTLAPKNKITHWNDTVLEKKYWCATCKMLPVCGGACPKSWEEGMPACPSFKFNMPERLLMKYVMDYRDIFTADTRQELQSFHSDKPWLAALLSPVHPS
ncbi:MAG: SPASM domain-containing protein [Chitinophagales bacterium]|nr:SPASM domain-containing protein [Chitinophagales bacterium]